jgi:hypothetical protein
MLLYRLLLLTLCGDRCVVTLTALENLVFGV